METIGFVGVGAMGSALLERLKAFDVEVVAFDTDRKALDAARALGARTASSASDVGGQSSMIDVVVRTDAEVLDCVAGQGGILEGAAPGTLILLHSTIRPDTTKKVAAMARSKDVEVIDACMTAVPRVVRQGGLTFLVGGPAHLVERARPHLMRMAKDVIHAGPLGAGNVAKLVKNLVTASEALIIHEAIQIARAGGITCREALEMMRKTRSEPFLERWQERFDLAGDDLVFRVGSNLYDKDIPLAAEVGELLGLDIPVTRELAAAAKRVVAANRARPSAP